MSNILQEDIAKVLALTVQYRTCSFYEFLPLQSWPKSDGLMCLILCGNHTHLEIPTRDRKKISLTEGSLVRTEPTLILFTPKNGVQVRG